MSREHTWLLRVGGDEVAVKAVDQHAAWNTLRNRPVEDFGIIVTALRADQDEGERIGVHTAALLLTWGRDDEARWLLEALRDAGIDSEPSDLEYAYAHGRTAPWISVGRPVVESEAWKLAKEVFPDTDTGGTGR